MSRNYKKLFPVAILILVLAALVTLPGEAGPNRKPGLSRPRLSGLKPLVTRPVKTGVSRALREMPATRAVDAATLAELQRREVNEKNSQGLNRVRSPWAPTKPLDSAIRGTRGGAAPSGSTTPPAGLTFEGLADADNGTVGLGLVNPPDTNADVGFTQIVETVNSVFRVYDKTGNPITPVLRQSDLFGRLGGQCAAADPGDPIVLYDRISDRWQISQFNFASTTTPPFHQCIAVSKTGDAAGEYYLYDFVTPGNNGNDFPDYPKLGVWSDGYYMSSRQFTLGGPFNGLGVYAFNRVKMIAGDPTAEQIFFAIPFDATYPSGTSSGIQPSDHDGLLPPPPGAPNVFAIYDSDDFGVADEVHLFDFHADFANPMSSTFTERTESPLLVPAFDDNSPPTRAAIEEPAGENLDAIADRLMHRLSYRNLSGVESLVTNHTVNVSGVPVTSAADYQAASRYYEFRKSTPGGAYAVYDSATFAPDSGNGATGTNRWMGSTAIDGQGNLAMGYSASSTTLLPSIKYVGRAFNGLGTSLGAEVTLFAGLGTQAAGAGNRWGDYTSMSVDPADDCTFWYANEYDPVGNTGFNWHTRIGNFIFPSCTPPAQGTLSGTITDCASGTPIGEVLVSVTGGPSEGFSSATANDGTFAIHLAPGTYTVTASSGIRNCQPGDPRVVTITNGGTTNFSPCLGGSPKVTLPENNPNPATVVGGKGPGQINANDCNLVNVEVQNAGCAPAANLVGTLSTNTPGVLITRPTSTYANLGIDATATNDTPFQVSTSPSFPCGTPIDFTLTITYDGGSNVLTFSLPTCQASPSFFSGTIQPGDPQTVSGRLSRNGVASSCAGKTCPGPFGSGPRSYDTFSFVNGGAVPACVTIDLSSACGNTILGSAYQGSFDPTNLCTNYLGDAGGSSSAVQFGVTVPAGATVVVVVMETSANTTCAYSGSVSGLIGNFSGQGSCPTSITTRVNAANIVLGEETFDHAMLTGAFNPVEDTITFHLYGPNDDNCSNAPIFTSIQTVDSGNGEYSSTPFTPTAPGVYRWIASFSGDKGGNPPASGACNDPNENVTVSAPTPTPSPTPSPQPVQALNLSTRMKVLTGDGRGIGGFIIRGQDPKRVLIRAIGPSLSRFGLQGFLLDTTLELHGTNGFVTVMNDNWQDTNGAAIAATGIPPIHNLESAILATLAPGPYTAIVAGKNGTVGLGLVEIYDLDPSSNSKLVNMSTRAFSDTGSNLMIAGFILGGSNTLDAHVIIRGIGPSLAAAGVTTPLADPSIELRNGEGSLLFSNNNWQDVPAQAMEISAAGLAPSSTLESAISAFLPRGAYTVLMTGQDGGIGNGLVEVYQIAMPEANPAQ